MMAAPPEIERGGLGDSAKLSSEMEFQSSEGRGGFAPGEKTDASATNGEHDAVVSVRAGAELGVVGESATCGTDLAGKSALCVSELVEEASGKVEEETPAKCSEKCAVRVEATNGTATIAASDDSSEMDGKRHEKEGKKEKRPRRRGGKGRDNKEPSKCFPIEKKEKELQYTRKEMNALRYEQLDYQKKKWIEIFSGFSPSVMQQYEELIGKKHQKHDPPSIEFDPRPQFLKSANQPENSEIEDEYSDEEDEEEEEDYSSIQKPAFVVKGEPDFDSGPPLDGLEYLRRVRWEAARIPNVKVAKIDKIKEQSVYMPQIPDIAKCPKNLQPLKEWEDTFLADFSELREKFSANSLIQSSSLQAHEFLVKIVESANSETTDSTAYTDELGIQEPIEEINPNGRVDVPMVSKILGMEPAARAAMLRRRISSVEKMGGVAIDDGLWLFALCAAVDCPVDADTGAALRSLLRKCAVLRAAKTEVDDEGIVLNILATISGRYFGQLEK
ncbi:uncharacterized protein LOC127247541 [Andrographis paniculata]|uniref:uncharacterized protein LOC127247541 n=1 Tax=Andrographis paniculata TaxID=175694 RepID=UPI0021E9724B|nr:uncharacterized protein LOC127247541 [Andrographis paniculata]